MSVTTNVPEQQLFFPGGAWTEAFERGLSNVSKWKCTTHGWRANWKMWNRVSRVQSLLNCFERFVGVCVCVCVCQHGKKTLLVCTLNGIALRKRPKFQNVESLRVALTNERRGVWLGNPRDGSPLLHESFSKPVTMSM